MFKLFFFVLAAIVCAGSAKPLVTYSAPLVAAPAYSSSAYAAYTAPVAAAYTSPYTAAYTAPFGYASPYAAYTAFI